MPSGLQALTLRLPKDLHRALRVQAAMEGRSVSSIIQDLVRAHLAEGQASHPAGDEAGGSAPT